MDNFDLLCHPAVFAIEDEYQIIVPMKSDALVAVVLAGKYYYDHCNGIIRSTCPVHKISVPAEILDDEKHYSISYRKIIERKPYFTETENEVILNYDFLPINPEKEIKIYHVSDSHGDIQGASTAYLKAIGTSPDLLVLNGDIADHSGDVEHIMTIYKIASGITNGTLPIVFSRGNHDLRGNAAELLTDYTPTSFGRSYYTFRTGSIWGIVLDTGEDKEDWHLEYGHTICCHEFREEETRYLNKVAASKAYNTEGIEYKLVISHVPFSYANTECDGNGDAPFDIETEIFTEWCQILKEHIKPDLMISGHTHKPRISNIGSDMDDHGQPAPLIIGGRPYALDDTPIEYTGCAITLSEKIAEVNLVDSLGNKQFLGTIKL